MGIGAFARRSRLSPKRLRLYDALGLLLPAHVDASSGYRFYEPAQLVQARLVSALRQLQVPPAEMRVIVGLEPKAAAEPIHEYWAASEAEHSARRDLAHYLVDFFSGKRSVMYVVTTRDIPTRSLLCLKRNVDGQQGAWTPGKRFVASAAARSSGTGRHHSIGPVAVVAQLAPVDAERGSGSSLHVRQWVLSEEAHRQHDEERAGPFDPAAPKAQRSRWRRSASEAWRQGAGTPTRWPRTRPDGSCTYVSETLLFLLDSRSNPSGSAIIT